jgi:outer membrane protein insertion porin family
LLNKLKAGSKKLRLFGLGISLLILFITTGVHSSADSIEGIMVTAVDVEASKYVSKADLRSLITATVVGEPLTEEGIWIDMLAIYSFGEKPDGKVLFEDVEVRFEEYRQGVKVIFVPIDMETPGQLPIIEGFMVDIDVLDEQWVLDRITIKAGDALTQKNVEKLKEDVNNILTLAQEEEGYSLLVTGDGLFMDNQGVIHLELRAVRLASVKVQGNEKTKTYVIEREILSTKVGDPLNTEAIIDDMGRIYRLGFFEDVIPNFTSNEDPLWVDLTFEVVEADTAELNFGLGLGGSGLSGYIGVDDKNMFGTGQMGGLYLEKSTQSSNYGVEFYSPRIADSSVSGGFSLYSNNQKLEDKDNYTLGGSISLGYRFNDLLKAETKLRVDNTSVKETDQPDRDDKLRSVSLSLSGDNTDHIFKPSKGVKYYLTLEKAAALFNGNIEYSKISGQVSKFQSIGKKGHVLAVRLMGGSISNDVEDNYLYRLGGNETLRTYGGDGDKMIGDKMFLSNVEYRIPINDSFQGVIFFDAGGAWDSNQQASILDRIKSSLGVEIRAQTAIGPLRLGYGLLGGEEKLILSLGPMF